jgi:hypothetical protein
MNGGITPQVAALETVLCLSSFCGDHNNNDNNDNNNGSTQQKK